MQTRTPALVLPLNLLHKQKCGAMLHLLDGRTADQLAASGLRLAVRHAMSKRGR